MDNKAVMKQMMKTKNLNYALRADADAEILKKLARDKDVEVLAAVASNPACPDDVSTNIKNQLGQSYSDYMKRGSNADLLMAIAGREDERSQLIIAENRNMPEAYSKDIFEKLSVSTDEKMRCQIASNYHTPESVLSDMAKNPDSQAVKLSLIENNKTPVSALIDIADTDDLLVKKKLLINERINKETMEKVLLPLDKCPSALLRDSEVALSLAKNTNTPSGVVDRLVESSVWEIKEAAINNTSISARGLVKAAEYCTKDYSELSVAKMIDDNVKNHSFELDEKEKAEVYNTLALSKSDDIKKLAYKSGMLGPEALKTYTDYLHKDIRLEIAKMSTPGVPDAFANDREPGVRKAVAMNHATSPEALDSMVKAGENKLIIKEVALNENTSPQTLNKIKSMAKTLELSDNFINQNVKSNKNYQEQTCSDLLKSLSDSIAEENITERDDVDRGIGDCAPQKDENGLDDPEFDDMEIDDDACI